MLSSWVVHPLSTFAPPPLLLDLTPILLVHLCTNHVWASPTHSAHMPEPISPIYLTGRIFCEQVRGSSSSGAHMSSCASWPASEASNRGALQLFYISKRFWNSSLDEEFLDSSIHRDLFFFGSVVQFRSSEYKYCSLPNRQHRTSSNTPRRFREDSVYSSLVVCPLFTLILHRWSAWRRFRFCSRPSPRRLTPSRFILLTLCVVRYSVYEHWAVAARAVASCWNTSHAPPPPPMMSLERRNSNCTERDVDLEYCAVQGVTPRVWIRELSAWVRSAPNINIL